MASSYNFVKLDTKLETELIKLFITYTNELEYHAQKTWSTHSDAEFLVEQITGNRDGGHSDKNGQGYPRFLTHFKMTHAHVSDLGDCLFIIKV